ncbi:MAG: leucine-rich repeat protein, partial [Lachnospiraceae bacterium]|nr:leucine-rich repeat protein [Lachnospiraceae bacterium]
ILLNEVTIPESCVSIGGGAFAQCQSVKNLTIPGKVTSIGRSAFIYCSKLESIELSASLETLGEGKGYGAFESCTSLKEIKLPNTVNVIGEATFKNCQNLEKATLPVGITKIDNELFIGCMKLAQVNNVSKDTLTEIGNSAFENCTALAGFDGSGKIDFSEYEKLNKIGNRAFYGCDALSAITMSAATVTLGDSVLDSCKNLATVTLATGAVTIPVDAFANDPGLVEVVVPRTVKTIKTGAFSKDINLEKIHISKDTELEDGVFSYCDKLTIYGFDPSAAKTYADKNHIPFIHDDVYADSIKFTDKSDMRLNLAKDKNVAIPGVDIKPVNYTVDVEFTTDNESIFTVDEYTNPKTKETEYVINPKGVGTATLTALVQSDATGKKISDTLSVTVKKAVESVSMASGMKKDNTINIPDTLQLAVVVKPDDATDKSVRWVSGDRSICDVDSEGVVYSKGVGETMVAAISNDDENKQFVFNVKVTDSDVKKADPSWPNNIQKPRIVGASGTTISSTYGAEIALACDTPGAQIYFTVDNSEPLADYEGHMDGATRHYTAPIVLNEATFGKEAIESGTLHINAKSIREGFQYSTPVNFVVNLTKGSEWGDIDPTTRNELFNNDLTKVPGSIWYAFKGDDKPYEKGQATKVKKEYADGKEITFNEDIRVFYGTSQLYEGRDYGV